MDLEKEIGKSILALGIDETLLILGRAMSDLAMTTSTNLSYQCENGLVTVNAIDTASTVLH